MLDSVTAAKFGASLINIIIDIANLDEKVALLEPFVAQRFIYSLRDYFKEFKITFYLKYSLVGDLENVATLKRAIAAAEDQENR